MNHQLSLLVAAVLPLAMSAQVDINYEAGVTTNAGNSDLAPHYILANQGGTVTQQYGTQHQLHSTVLALKVCLLQPHSGRVLRVLGTHRIIVVHHIVVALGHLFHIIIIVIIGRIRCQATPSLNASAPG